MALEHRRGMPPREFLNTPEGRYRRLQAIAAQRAREYTGSEDSDNKLWAALRDFESCAVEFGDGDSILEKESDAAQRMNPMNSKDVDIMLAIAIRALSAAVHESLEGRPSIIVTKHFPGIYFPPGENPIRRSLDGRSEWKEPRFDEAVINFLRILRTIGVYTDDVMLLPELQQPKIESVQFEGREVTLSKVQNPTEQQMREEAYIRIVIPRLNRTVMLCNQVGEAAFVFEGIVPDEYITTHKKEECVNDGVYAVTKVSRGPQWAEHMRAALLGDESKSAGPKIDIVGWDDIRTRGIEALRATYPPEVWLVRGARNLDIDVHPGMSLVVFGEKLGYENVYSRLFRMEIASLVWPNNLEIAEELRLMRIRERATTRSADEWVARVREVIGPDEFLAMIPEQASMVRIDGVELSRIARTLGLSKTPTKSLVSLFAFAKRIYPENKAIRIAFANAREEQRQNQERKMKSLGY